MKHLSKRKYIKKRSTRIYEAKNDHVPNAWRKYLSRKYYGYELEDYENDNEPKDLT